MEEYKNDEIMSPFKTSDTGLYQDCPKRACNGKVYNIDDNLISTIMILNSKGFPTYSSCAGHQLEIGTETYIEFSDEVKSLPMLPEGFKLRMKTIGGVTRLSIYRKPESEDPVSEHAELLDFAEILYEWALNLDFNIDGMEVVFVNLDDEFASLTFSSLYDAFRGNGENEEEDKPKDSKKKLDVNKLKESAPKASIKLKRTESEVKAEEQDVQKETADEDLPKEGKKEEKPKAKRGRPKKNQD